MASTAAIIIADSRAGPVPVECENLTGSSIEVAHWHALGDRLTEMTHNDLPSWLIARLASDCGDVR